MAKWKRLAKPDLAPRDGDSDMFYVYILKSEQNGDLYVGSTTDLRVRFHQHNNRKVTSTKAYVPWRLVYYEAYRDKRDITRRERQLKNHRAKEDLRQQLEYSLK